MANVAAVGAQIASVISYVALIMTDVPAFGAGGAIVAIAHVAAKLVAVMSYISSVGMDVAPVGAAVKAVMPQIAAVGPSIRSQSKS